MTQVTNTGIGGRVAGLDELRGLSILWVMLSHSTALWTWMPFSFAGYGFHGVVLFFAISGYLITKILLEAEKQDDYFSNFYVNRVFRIWPLMLLALAVSAYLWPQMAPMGVFNLLMINNYAYAYGLEPMVRTDVMWSLAIEEQFYLIWPVLAYFYGKRGLAVIATVIIFLGFSFDAGLLPGGQNIISKTTHGNMQYIAMGCLVAVGRDSIRYMIGAWCAFMLFYMSMRGGVGGLVDFRWWWHGISFFLGLLVYLTVYWRPVVIWSPLAEIGKLCYGLYLIHFFISWAILEHFGRGMILQGSAFFLISYLLAFFSYRYFEKPIINSRNYFHASMELKVVLFAGMGLMAMISAIMLIPTMKFMG